MNLTSTVPMILISIMLAFASCSPSPLHAQDNPFDGGQPGYPEWSPFTAVRWEGDVPIVQVDGQWYQLVSFHGIATSSILDTCRKRGWDARKRLAEDPVQIIRLMGHKIDRTTDLELRDSSDKIITLKNVVMTEANAKKIKIRRKIKNRRKIKPDDAPQPLLDNKHVAEDLRVFQASLESQFAYLNTNDVDYVSAIELIATKADEKVSREWLANELQQVMARFIDGHARVKDGEDIFLKGYLPFLIEPSGDQFVAMHPDRGSLIDKNFPYLKSIDGIPLKRWIDATGKYIAQGSPQYRRRQAIRMLGAIQQFRSELGIELSETIAIELVSRDGESKKSLSLKVAQSSVRAGWWRPSKKPGILAGNIGYLPIQSMNNDAVRLIQTWLPKFRETSGLIVDVRGNGGGSRGPLLELAGYLLDQHDAPRIGNVAKYRLAKHFPEDHLSARRYIHREQSRKFDERERSAITAFKKTFTPEWTPPEQQFSQWHYLVLAKKADDPRYHYDKPVVILMDESCFSATDIFLGALKGWPGVTLIGQPSGGGSARSKSFKLPNSRIDITCASMASFQPDGKLYDTHGIEPDLIVTRPPEYYLKKGEDTILKAALDKLARTED